jgi:hypothetical protein
MKRIEQLEAKLDEKNNMEVKVIEQPKIRHNESESRINQQQYAIDRKNFYQTMNPQVNSNFGFHTTFKSIHNSQSFHGSKAKTSKNG